MIYDFIIVGAGPAGSTLARLISPRYKVLIADKRSFEPDKRETKACGGLLNSDAQKELATQGLSLPKSVLSHPLMFDVKAIDLESGLARYYQKHYINIHRSLFDDYLYKLIPAYVDKIEGAYYLRWERGPDYISVIFRRGSEELTYKTRQLISAEGAGSKILRELRTEEELPKIYVCPQAFFQLERPCHDMFALFDRTISDYYSWGVPKEGGILIGAAIEDRKEATKKYQLLLSKLGKLGLDLGERVYNEGAILFRPSKRSDIFLGRDRVHFIGEAAGLISPSSSEGVSYALKSARLLAEEINRSYLGFDLRYERALRPVIAKILFKIAQGRVMYQPALRHLIFKTDFLALRDKKNSFFF